MNDQRPKLFGTDGIRGAFGTAPLVEPTVRRLGAALASELLSRHPTNGDAPRVVLGGDTRDSTPILSSWLNAELRQRGFEVLDLGTVPTPCVADRTIATRAACGIAISASHNPHPDNGIKLIDGDGFKWSKADELAVEARLAQLVDDATFQNAPEPPQAVRSDIVQQWLDGLLAGLPGDASLQGLKVALDTGHGAASPYAEDLFRRLGADVVLVHAAPNGSNINADCGSTHPEVIAGLTRQQGADLGFAFDGDADRVIVADELGNVRDGDAILYLWARALDADGALPGRRIVATTMSNLGLEVALRRDGMTIVRCDVGDRHVVSTMETQGIILGGEQSGHIVHRGLSTAGDGMLTALHLAVLRQKAATPLSQQLQGFQRFPQILQNVRVTTKPDLQSLPRLQEARQQVEEALGDEGRLVLRYSGTEPLARVMIEGPDQTTIQRLANDLAHVIAEEIG